MSSSPQISNPHSSPHSSNTQYFNFLGRVFIPQLNDYDISPITGFLPSDPPLARLSGEEFVEWEALLDNLRPLLLMKQLRSSIRSLPLFPTASLGSDVRLWRRANLVISMLTSAYVWGHHRPPTFRPASTDFTFYPNENNDLCQVLRWIPAVLAVPLTETAMFLGLRPIICYATSGLWNWFPLNPTQPLSLSNLGTLNTFTGTTDESWFYLIPVGIELEGAPALAAMVRAWTAVANNDHSSLLQELNSMLPILANMTRIIKWMHDRCDPHIFYHQIRLYLAGWALVDQGVHYDQVDASKLPNSWFLAHGSPPLMTDTPRQATFFFAGGSAGQSSLIQAWDVFLGVQHHPTGTGPGALSSSDESSQHQSSNNFITEMRHYMPRGHRHFLNDAEKHAPKVRDYVLMHAHTHPALLTAYNAIVDALGMFRDIHLQIVARFIIMQSRKNSISMSTSTSVDESLSLPKSPITNPISIKRQGNITDHLQKYGTETHNSSTPTSQMLSTSAPLMRNHKLESIFSFSKLTQAVEDTAVRGTGGTQLIPFLKQTRKETTINVISEQNPGKDQIRINGFNRI